MSKNNDFQQPVGSDHTLPEFCAKFALFSFVIIVLVLIFADQEYLRSHGMTLDRVWEIICSDDVFNSLKLSFITSSITLLLIILTAVPIGFALSRYRFRGHSFLNTVVDVPIVLPPVVIGLSLLAFFGAYPGIYIKEMVESCGWSLTSGIGIVMCQYLVSVSYCIRAMKASFDGVDRNLENVALSLGCSPTQTFFKVTLPLARNGLIAGSVMAWARAIGVFGPLMVYVGTSTRVSVMPTAMYLEFNNGNIEVALVIALITVAIAGLAIIFVHWLVPGGPNE